MEDDEDALSILKIPPDSDLERETLETGETKNAEECEFLPESGESKLSVVGERNEMILSETVTDEGGETDGLENNAAVESLVVMEVVTVEEWTEEGNGEAMISDFESPQLKTIAEEGSERVDPREDEISVDPKLEIGAEEEFMTIDDSKVEVFIADADEAPAFSESPKYARGDDLLAESEGLELQIDIADLVMESVLSEGGKAQEMGAQVDLADGGKFENDFEVVGDVDVKEKVEFVENYLHSGKAEKSYGIEEERVYHFIAKETRITDVNTEMELITEVNTNLVNVSEDDRIRESSGADVIDKLSDNKEVSAEEKLMSETKMVEENGICMNDVKDFKLVHPVNAAENRGVVVTDEEFPTGNIGMETDEGVESNMMRKYVPMPKEVQLEDAEVETWTTSMVVTDKITGDGTTKETKNTIGVVTDRDQEMDDSLAALQNQEDEKITDEEVTEIESETEVAESKIAFEGKRKRTKFASSSISKATTKASSRKKVGEDVCFICFESGELVLCGRRGCPKAYHPSCVNRDEAFFRAKGRWNCGWHMCNICEKNAVFMCYTCTFSLCKRCSKDAVISCVRGNKGFCEICKRTVMLIENNEQGKTDMKNQIDFDDGGGWEYLFKDYYIQLKYKLSLSSVEVAEAKNPWKGSSVLSGLSKQESSEAQADENDEGSGSDDSIENLNTIKAKRRKSEKKPKSLAKEKELVSAGDVTGDEVISSAGISEWASKELLEFVSHMKNGDISKLSQFDVQDLLLEYIKINKLRDPRRKSQIVCDTRLEIIFGKPRVGHFEMLKLLDSHFLIRDEQNEDVQESVIDIGNNQLDVDGNADHLTKGVKVGRRKICKRCIRRPLSNLDGYAAIDMHNISLIYLRRKLMEDLLEDVQTFHDKVVGMFVRIRISGSLQKQDMYRLVQVVGTSKAEEPYKIGKKTTDILIEILNLDKIEVISVDAISNQEFTEEECKRLGQIVKCGLMSRLTVGEILDKTKEIQAAKVNDWLESEIVQLCHLRDRASDLGHQKELRGCVEKLKILKTPEDRQRRLKEIPEIHSDPKMDPSYESDDHGHETEDSRQDDFRRSRGSAVSRGVKDPLSSEGDDYVKDSWGSPVQISSKNLELSRRLSGNKFSANAPCSGEMVNENCWSSDTDQKPHEFNNLEKRSSDTSMSADRTTNAAFEADLRSGVSSLPSQASLPAGVVEITVKVNDKEKIWHYQDPSGKVQGPFSLARLRKWNKAGYFPSDLKIWRTTEKQDQSILISNALVGKFQKELPAVDILDTTSLNHDRVMCTVDRNPRSVTKLSTEKQTGNPVTNIPSQETVLGNAGRSGGEGDLPAGAIQSPGVKGVIPSPTAVLPNIEPHSTVQCSTYFNPTPSTPQLGKLVDSADSLTLQPTIASEPHGIKMNRHPSTVAQPVQQASSQNPLAETQGWGNIAESGQPQDYGWTAPNIQNSTPNFSNPVGPPSEFWRPNQGSQPNIYPHATPNASWGIAPAENNTPLGVRPEVHNTGWGMQQANPNLGVGNPPPGNTNMNGGHPVQVPTRGNTNSNWVAPTANAGANTQGPMSGNVNSGWTPTPGWGGPPVEGPIPGNRWGPAGPHPPMQVSAQGTSNQGWGAPQGNHGSWGAEQNHNEGQFSGQMNGQGRDSTFVGGRPCNRQPTFGGGRRGGHQHFNRRDVLCPYNVNRRCRKGAYCEYLHV